MTVIGKMRIKNSPGPQYTMVSLLMILFFISFIKSWQVLALGGMLVSGYALLTDDNKFFLRWTKPVLPFVLLMLLPVSAKYIINGNVGDWDFTLLIIGKVLISAVLLGTIVAQHSILYLLEGILGLGLPPALNRILALTLRYFHMIDDDLKKGRIALLSRGINERKGLAAVSIFGEWIGGFFLKSTEHGERVFHAMQLRGFEGEGNAGGFKNKGQILQLFLLVVLLLVVLVIDGGL